MAVKGALLKFSLMGLRIMQFLISGLILGIYSYFLSVLADRKLNIRNPDRAVEGIAGAACVYTICGFLFTCCCGGNPFASGVALFLDIAFVIAFVAIAIIAKGGNASCSNGSYVDTPVGQGVVGTTNSLQGFGGSGFGKNDQGTANLTAGPTFKLACNLEKVVLAVAIIGIFFWIFTAALTFLLAKVHRSEKKYGPSPTNNYTTGSGRRGLGSRFKFGRKKRTTRDAELGGVTGTAVGEKPYAMETGTANGTFDRTPATNYRKV